MSEASALISEIRRSDYKVVFILLSVAVVELIAFYYGSKRFYVRELAKFVADGRNAYFLQYIYWMCAKFLLHFPLLLLLGWIFLREKPRAFGVSFGDYKLGLAMTAVFVGVMLPIIWIVSASPSFAAHYPHCGQVRTDWTLFIIYEFCFILYMVGWEFIWRGYMLFGLKDKLGDAPAILIQTLPFVILHFGKPPLETFGSIIAGIALGILALRTRTFIYCALIHWLVMFSIDLTTTLRYRAGEFGLGFDSLIKILDKAF